MESRNEGFTLVEIMFTVAIIGILASLAGYGVMKAVTNARIKEATAQVAMIGAAVERLAWDTGKWPNKTVRTTPGSVEVWDISGGESGLTGNDGTYDNWKGPYYASDFKDPWGNNYFFDPDYRVDGKMVPVVGSFGPNGVGRNRYDSDDIYVQVND